MKDLEALFPKPGVTVTREIHKRPEGPFATEGLEPLPMGFLLKITPHADLRIKQRTSLNRKAARRLLDNFYEKAIRPEDCTKDLAGWVQSKLTTRGSFQYSGIVGRILWVIDHHKVITVLQIPPEIEITTKPSA